jgi:hypothetical protein
MRDARTILLLLLSVCLIATWVYHIYDKSKYAVAPAGTESVAVQENTKHLNDSLITLYRSTIAQLETVIVGKDSLSRELQQKAGEIDTLKTEIVNMLNEQTVTKEDLRKALMKIQALQVKIYQFNNQSNGIRNNPVSSNAPVNQPVTSSVNIKTKIPETVDASFTVQDIMAQAVGGNSGSQLSVSFLLKSAGDASGTASLYMILKDPRGNTVQDDEWIAGVFSSKSEGMLRYSKKLNWDYNRNDSHKFSTSIPVTNFTKGVYQLFIYCNGQKLMKKEVVINE